MRTFSGNASYNKSKFSFIPPLTKKNKLHTILFCVGTEAKGLVVRIAFTTDFYLLTGQQVRFNLSRVPYMLKTVHNNVHNLKFSNMSNKLNKLN